MAGNLRFIEELIEDYLEFIEEIDEVPNNEKMNDYLNKEDDPEAIIKVLLEHNKLLNKLRPLLKTLQNYMNDEE